MLGSLFVLAFPGLALAQTPGAATGGWVGAFTIIAAGIGMAIAAGLCGLGQGRAVAAAVDRYLTGSSQLPAPISPYDRPMTV